MSNTPTLFLLHGLGCSARLWQPVERLLGTDVDCVALDLPGHGAERESSAITVEQMVDDVVTRIRQDAPELWAIAGHSMGGKIAALVTARAERCIGGLHPPIALALVAASPLSPEPMSDDDRRDMLGWAEKDGAHGIDEADAETFVDANTARRLPDDLRAAAVVDVRTANPRAWRAWLERGSLEDWRGSGSVHTTALVVAGAEDDDLGVQAQQDLVLPLVNATAVVPVADAAHLIPLEAPSALADLLRDHVLGAADRWASLGTEQARLLSSDRVSARTRGVLTDRLGAPSSDGVLGVDRLRLLDALVRRLVPQQRTDVDLAARLDAQLASGAGDGWRFAELPDDVEAWRRGLDTIESQTDFGQATSAQQDAWVGRIIDGEVGSSDPAHLDSDRLVLWFENVRAEAIRAWLAHPSAQAAIGYDGYAGGGDGERLQGYLRVGEREMDEWQSQLPRTDRAAS